MNIKCRVINQLMQLWCFLTLPCIIQTYFILQWTEKADESQAWMTPFGIPQSPSWTTWLIRSAGTLTGMEGWGLLIEEVEKDEQARKMLEEKLTEAMLREESVKYMKKRAVTRWSLDVEPLCKESVRRRLETESSTVGWRSPSGLRW